MRTSLQNYATPGRRGSDKDRCVGTAAWLPKACGSDEYFSNENKPKCVSQCRRPNSDLCGKHVSKRPYGELGSVSRSSFFCCVSVDSSLGPISPGCCCDGPTVDEIVELMKERMRLRGDTAQIQRAEHTLQRLEELDAKLVRFA